MHIKCKILKTGQIHELEVDPMESGKELIKKLADLLKIQPDAIRLVACQRIVKENESLQYNNIVEGTEVSVTIKPNATQPQQANVPIQQPVQQPAPQPVQQPIFVAPKPQPQPQVVVQPRVEQPVQRRVQQPVVQPRIPPPPPPPQENEFENIPDEEENPFQMGNFNPQMQQNQQQNIGNENMQALNNLKAKWKNQLETIKMMGIQVADEEICQLLEICEGNIEQVMAQLFDM